jgi:hypothetical protein
MDNDGANPFIIAQEETVSPAMQELIDALRAHPIHNLMNAIKAHDVEGVRELLPTCDINFRAGYSTLGDRAFELYERKETRRRDIFAFVNADEYKDQVPLTIAIQQFWQAEWEQCDSKAREAIETILRLILEHPMLNPNLMDNNSWPPIASALQSGCSPRALQILLEYQDANKLAIPLDLTIACQGGRRPVGLAIERGNFAGAQTLLNRQGLDVHLLNGSLEHPLHELADAKYPCLEHSVEAQQLLLGLIERGSYVNCTKKANIVRTDEHGQTLPARPEDKYVPPFEHSQVNRNHVISPLLCALGGRFGSQIFHSDCPVNMIPLHANTFLYGLWHDPIAKTPVEGKGSPLSSYDLETDPNLLVQPCTYSRLTPCMIAAARGWTPMLKALIQRGATVNDRTTNEWTALHFAAYNGHGSTVRVLLSQPDIITCPRTNKRPWMAENAHGLSPYDLALIGHEARKQGNEHTNDTAIAVLDEFNQCRLTTFMYLARHAEEVGLALPVEIIERIVRSYRFSEKQSDEQKLQAKNNDSAILNSNN